MQNMRSYFSSWKPFWKSSTTGTLTLAPSTIHFASSSLGDLNHSIIDEKLMLDISTRLIKSISPPKLQIYAHQNHWFALNNSHLLVYRQLERVGLCDTVVCDIIRSEDIPIGIRETITPVVIPEQEQRSNGDRFRFINDEEPQSQDEVVYCADMQANSCGCLDDDDSIVSDDESDSADDSDDEQAEWSINPSLCIATISNNQFDLDNDDLEESHKELQSLL